MRLPAWARARGEALAFGALLLLHAGFCLYFAPKALRGALLPPSNDAFAVAVYRVARARLSAPGEVFTYDPQVLAGQIAGLAEPFGGRALSSFVLGLGALGVAPVGAFNGTLVALHVCFPLLGYAAARTFGLRSTAALITFALWSFAWFFDSLVHYSWYSGRIEWTIASAIALSGAGLAWRVKTSGSIVRGSLSVAVVLALATLFHPIPAIFCAAFAVLPLALAGGGVLGPRRLGIAAPALVPVAIVAFVFARGGATSSEPLATVYRASLLEPLWDAVEILGPGNGAPGAARTLARTFCFVGAFLQLSALRDVGDGRALPLGAAASAGVILGYAGAFLPVAWPVDPYFFLIPAFLGASVLTALLLAGLQVPSLLRTGPLALRVGVGLAALVFVPRVFRAVATYVPELLPTRVERAALDYRVSALVGVNEPLPEPFGLEPPPPSYAALAGFIEQNFSNRGRIVTDDPAFTAFLATRTLLPVLGPIAERGAASAGADPTRFLRDAPADVVEGAADESALASYLERYAAGVVVLLGPESAFDRSASGVLEPALAVPGILGARVRRVRVEPTLFAEGKGRVTLAALGHLRVVAEPAPRVVLRFHYDHRLECRPSCTAVSVVLPGAPNGFVGVERPPPEFELFLR